MSTTVLPGDSVRIDKLHPVAKLFGGTRGAERYRNRPVEQLRKIRKPKR